MANSDNPGTGANFERDVQAYFASKGVALQPNHCVPVGAGHSKKVRKFDLGSEEPPVLIECKCHTWTAGGNSPSAKLTIWNEAMLYFSVAPPAYRKILVVNKSVRGTESLVEHYLSRFEHLIPPGVEIWELDPVAHHGQCVHESAVPHFRKPSALLKGLAMPLEILVEFFVTFARFEFALKMAGFVHGDQWRVFPDWDRFGLELADTQPGMLDAGLKEAVYLAAHPPRKQILVDGRLGWAQPQRLRSDIENVLLSVRTVRNNVFHGGKFPLTGYVEEPLRDERLVRECLGILNAVLELPTLPTGVRDYFSPPAYPDGSTNAPGVRRPCGVSPLEGVAQRSPG